MKSKATTSTNKNLFENDLKESLNIEHIILSSCLKDGKFLEIVRKELKKEHFIDPDYQLIFEKTNKLYDEKILSHESLILSFKNEAFKSDAIKKRILKKTIDLDKEISINEKGLRLYLDNHIKSYRFNIIEKKFENFLKTINQNNYEDKLLNLLSEIENEKQNFKSNKFIKISKVISNLVADLRDRTTPDNFLRTNFVELDKLINGFYPGELIIIAGLTSIGKTSFSLALLWNIAKNLKDNEECVYCSFEMTNEQLIKRIAASELAIELSKINTKSFSDQEAQKFLYFEEHMKKNDHISFTLNKNPELKDVDELYYEIKKAFNDNVKMKALFVDYLQLMSAKAINSSKIADTISYITKVFKRIAVEFKIPVIVLSQFSRKANDNQPAIYHLKESSSIEQDADIVLLLYKKDSDVETNPDDPVEIILNVGKNRNGRIGSIKLHFLKNFCKFISTNEKVIN